MRDILKGFTDLVVYENDAKGPSAWYLSSLLVWLAGSYSEISLSKEAEVTDKGCVITLHHSQCLALASLWSSFFFFFLRVSVAGTQVTVLLPELQEVMREICCTRPLIYPVGFKRSELPQSIALNLSTLWKETKG